ncbi:MULTISPECIES: exodeoxyribonuclease VII large subunit [unclassified Luteimonas]|uniref:exodeoxyribonuclease VII large subunit n=1 Tax=unclassified Luteimonas TaxID=2629088 RepID=UPI001601BB41|nr:MULTISPECIES: exodeoxyribonuclease VII large subunit [unclassified Luteimonas]MBB1471559.1 exodeoxyribonuclease VII large subunit [Luteimonas sp. MC1782]MBB6599702.1 exodeoxyribonuclease VII large subunit [Luteimonas sp. MC1825]QOC87386.1 exodeoxyribonuclease VII large subunit [Luteimonas sp. MC1825]
MPAASENILTPSQLNTLARSLLEDAFPVVLVEGELANVSRPASGHLYFTLKDARAQVRCALFRPKSQWLKFQPRDGLKVIARGRLTLYEARGDYQLILDSLEEAGEGALRRAFEELKARLQAEGLFDDARKRPLPAYPRRLAVITSPSGAAVRDVLSVLARRFPLVEVDVLPVPVQGEAAAAQIRAMLERAGASGRYDVLVLARGGGSLEDLWAFNDEALARAIAASPVPVVSAVGHETDFSLADFAADLRAPTPSVAAELLVPDRVDVGTRLRGLHQRLGALHLQQLRNAMQRTDRAALRLHAVRPQARLQALGQRQQDALRRLQAAWRVRDAEWRSGLRHADAVLRATHPARRLAALRERLASLAPRPQAAVARRLRDDALRLHGLARSLQAVSPLATVARGYAILQHADGRVVRTTGDAAVGDVLDARLADGALRLRVESRKDT